MTIEISILVYIPENLLAGDIPVCGQPLYLKQTEKFFDGSALPTPAYTADPVITFAGIVAPVQPKQHLAELGIAIVTVVISGRAWVINGGTNNVSADNCHPGAPYTLLGTRAGTIITPLDTENLILAVDLFPVARWTFDRRGLS
jgi:hypothetical protein